MWEGQKARDHAVVVPVAIARSSAEAGGDGWKEWLGLKMTGLGDEPILVPTKCRVSVHTFRLQRHPVWPKISFFQDVDADISQLGNTVGGNVVGTAVAEQHQIGDLVLAQVTVEKCRPVGKAATEVYRPCRPIPRVTAANIDAVDDDSTLGHGPA